MFHAVSRLVAGVFRDARVGARLLARERGFGIVAIAVLALGTAGVATQITIVDTLLHRLLPFSEAERLMTVSLRHKKGLMSNGHPDAGGAVRLGDFLDIEREQSSFVALAAYIPASFPTRINGAWHRFDGSAVSSDFFRLLGVEPIRGRVFAEGEQPRHDDVVVISNRMWEETFGRDPEILHRTLRIGEQTRTIIGVMPDGFQFPRSDLFWVPLQAMRDARDGEADVRPLRPVVAAIGRLKPGITPEQARTEIALIAERLAAAYPETNASVSRVEVGPLADAFMSAPFRQLLYAMLGAVVILLLVAVFNVTNLQLARTVRRLRDLAVRSALGATRGRLLRQVVTESALIGVSGVVAGVVLSWWCNRVVRVVVTSDIRGSGIAPPWAAFDFRPGVLVATVLVIGAIFLAAGLVPALHATRANVAPLLQAGGRSVASGVHERIARWLVVAQFAFTFPLLFASLAMVRSFVGQQGFDWGFPVDGLATNRVSLRGVSYPDSEARRLFQDRLLLALTKDSLVSHAALVTRGPSLYQARSVSAYEVEGREAPDDRPMILMLEYVSSGFFATVELPVVQGRDFEPHDVAAGRPVGIVNVSWARRHFPHDDPIGKRFRLVGPHDEPGDWVTIVGVVPDISIVGPKARVPSNVPCAFLLISPANRIPSEVSIVARGPAPPELLARALADRVARLDPELSLYGPTLTPREHLFQVLRPRRNLTLVFCVFAVVAVIMAVMGLFGVIAYSVQRRGAEIGIRMALGADRPQIMRLVFAEGAKQLAWGGAIGLGATLALALATRDFSSRFLYQVNPLDPVLLGATGLLLAGSAVTACLVPARRATRVRPVVALRME